MTRTSPSLPSSCPHTDIRYLLGLFPFIYITQFRYNDDILDSPLLRLRIIKLNFTSLESRSLPSSPVFRPSHRGGALAIALPLAFDRQPPHVHTSPLSHSAYQAPRLLVIHSL